MKTNKKTAAGIGRAASAENIATVNRAARAKPLVAYFCMEYGLDSDFKIYSGGLGILAGDHIKAAKDAGYPMVAIGILWRQGYTSQTIGKNGMPVDAFPEYRYPQLKDTGATVKVKIKKTDVHCKVWLCDCYSNIPLYLLDAFVPENSEQLVTGQLYGWFGEERLAQEIILGVGGLRALEALGICPDVYHFNEGHAALAGLELIRLGMAKRKAAAAEDSRAATDTDKQASKNVANIRNVNASDRNAAFAAAWADARKKIVFTTHTPVAAGNESHSYRAIKYIGADLGFSLGELRQIGGDPFNMTVAGLRLSRAANAVSELHAATAADMWSGVDGAVGIIPITNGVHNPTWQDGDIAIAANPRSLWSRHVELKRLLLDEVRARTGAGLDGDCLTIGFARRAAPYKRSDLIFRDEGIVGSLLNGGKIQIIFSGKAHPNDLSGKQIVANLAAKAEQYPGRVVFLENYDMEIGALMTRGCDIWLNNPIRPQEASGTSGMKAAMNGVLNFSVLDGWWPEGCVHGENGWQIGGGYEGDNRDQADADSLYEILASEIIPTYYNNRDKWVEMMANSIAMSQQKFSAERMLGEYISKMYMHP